MDWRVAREVNMQGKLGELVSFTHHDSLDLCCPVQQPATHTIEHLKCGSSKLRCTVNIRHTMDF